MYLLYITSLNMILQTIKDLQICYCFREICFSHNRNGHVKQSFESDHGNASNFIEVVL